MDADTQPQQAEEPKPVIKFCVLCQENYNEAKDPYHLEACREARKP